MVTHQTDTSASKIKGLGLRSEPKPMTTLLVSTPGLLEESLKATLDALPAVNVIGSASGCLSALYMVRELKPELIVIDSNQPAQDVQTLVKQLKQENLPTRALVLTMTRQQERCALAAGADATFHRDACTEQLVEILARLAGGGHAPRQEPDKDLAG